MKHLHVFTSIFALTFSQSLSQENNENFDDLVSYVSQTVRGGLKSTESKLPEKLDILAKFYNNPRPHLYTENEITLTCLGTGNYPNIL